MTTAGLDAREQELFNEIFHLMNTKFTDLKEKFGIWRIHNHFDINEDEVFHETSDPVTRESTLRIIKRKDLPQNAFASSWQLTDKGAVAALWCCDDAPVQKPILR